ncbi:hypothetical protein F4823DRAFT_561794 [Ustulina deusta]|nr:hypothetical protein F4823DRAFT_561794 [Ustulina deusta]
MADKARATLFLPQQNLYPFAADSKKISTLRNGYGYQLSRGIAQFASIKFASIIDKSMDITMADGSQPSSPDLMEGIEYQGLPRTSGSECARFLCLDKLLEALLSYSHLSHRGQLRRSTGLPAVDLRVVERHIMKKLKEIFSPLNIINLTESKIESIVSELLFTKRQRLFLQDRIRGLEEEQEVFRSAIGSPATSS